MKKFECEFVIVIPARYASTRLPGKPLRLIAGKPLVQHVFEKAKAAAAAHVIIATDDDRIEQVARAFGADVCRTSTDHTTGTDRLAEVAQLRQFNDDTIIVNLQGDEPLIPVAVLRQVAHNLHQCPRAEVATLSTVIDDVADLFNPNVVKVVTDQDGMALYFSRAAIPWARDDFADGRTGLPLGVKFNRHMGLYAYRGRFLKQYRIWSPCKLEQIEALEQLRVLWYGGRIHVEQAVAPAPAGVDTLEDLLRVEHILLNA